MSDEPGQHPMPRSFLARTLNDRERGARGIGKNSKAPYVGNIPRRRKKLCAQAFCPGIRGVAVRHPDIGQPQGLGA
jgi:hypothetical protein